MKHSLRHIVLLLSLFALPHAAYADALKLGPDASFGSVLADHTGKRVSLVLESGTELTGTVVSVSDELVHLSGLAGREYFDAAVDTDNISAVIVRTKQ